MRGFLAKSLAGEQVISSASDIVTSWIYQEGILVDALSLIESPSVSVYLNVVDSASGVDAVSVQVYLGVLDTVNVLEALQQFALVGVGDGATLADDVTIETRVDVLDAVVLGDELTIFVFLAVADHAYLRDSAVRKQKRVMYLRSSLPAGIVVPSFIARDLHLLSVVPHALSFSWDINLKDWVEN